jgi:hypothetical protein
MPRSLSANAVWIGVVGLTTVCALALLVRPPASASAAERRQAAEQRWAARGFDGYRIVSRLGECMQRGEFQGERVVSIERRDCLDSIRTVESLFSLIERIESWGLGRPRCAPSGCVCRERRAITAVYDEQLGYPRAVRLHKFRSVDWLALLRYPTAYPAALDCANPPVIELLKVFELEPLAEH